MVKGGKWWMYERPKPVAKNFQLKKVKYYEFARRHKDIIESERGEQCKWYKPATYATCKCYWAKDGKRLVREGKKVKKNIKNAAKNGKFYMGEVNAFHLEVSAS